ncbi:hypothetical protein C1I95_23650 [Micromonospora craterilacus]|uniref:Uncharacterized protein n=2 Tax=Micromonospora craterilacus TaxID=1655439 RepID=A0A2W2DTA3_9ACTN|nr:hypothetical protein C1I95_23650 [Micromonospora craterilacus]
MRTEAAYLTDTVPDSAAWTPAYLTTGDLGPYPGQIAHGYQHNDSVIARFTAETVARIAADASARSLSNPEQPADLLVLRDYGSGVEVLAISTPGTPTGGLARPDEPTAVGLRQFTADADGWYRLADNRWRWRHVAATPPSHTGGGSRSSAPEVFEPDGPDAMRCSVCGATGYDIAYDEVPSMAGHGVDTTIWCRICRCADMFAEEVGWTSRRTIWPPVLVHAAIDASKGTRR